MARGAGLLVLKVLINTKASTNPSAAEPERNYMKKSTREEISSEYESRTSGVQSEDDL